jgi:PPM family protein phosphatase
MGMLTIGAFAAASRLSPKALRHYDELGLLPPARVDPVTGYRLYSRQQLDQARLVAWLRRLGMPLARIRAVCALPAAAAAGDVAAFWAQVEADTAARRELATFLIDHLSGTEPAMPTTSRPLQIRYAARSDAGLVRPSNQDTAFAGARLLAVADGYGSAGASASAAAVEVLKRLDTGGIPVGDLLNLLHDAAEQANQAVRGAVAEPAPQSGTTLTGMLWTGSQLALIHIGDSRAYLLRSGELFQITHDHTLVQSMVDDGRLSPEEATTHPQRALLLRSLAGTPDPAADIGLHDAEPGDRYLLCSDGLSAVVPADRIRAVVAAAADPEQAVQGLIALANAAGGPDNVSCVVADVLAPQG